MSIRFLFSILLLTILPASCSEDSLEHTITFESNEGILSSEKTVSVENGSKLVKPKDPSRENYIFKGWFADSTLNTSFDFETPITKDEVIYAKWEENISLNSSSNTVVEVVEGQETIFNFTLSGPSSQDIPLKATIDGTIFDLDFANNDDISGLSVSYDNGSSWTSITPTILQGYKINQTIDFILPSNVPSFQIKIKTNDDNDKEILREKLIFRLAVKGNFPNITNNLSDFTQIISDNDVQLERKDYVYIIETYSNGGENPPLYEVSSTPIQATSFVEKVYIDNQCKDIIEYINYFTYPSSPSYTFNKMTPHNIKLKYDLSFSPEYNESKDIGGNTVFSLRIDDRHVPNKPISLLLNTVYAFNRNNPNDTSLDPNGDFAKILLHETGHLLTLRDRSLVSEPDFMASYCPSFQGYVASSEIIEGRQICWHKDSYVTRFLEEPFYQNPISSTVILSLINNNEFVTPLASESVKEDMAESFFSYVTKGNNIPQGDLSYLRKIRIFDDFELSRVLKQHILSNITIQDNDPR